MRSFPLLLLFFSTSFGGYLEACYRIYIIFIPVAESCVKYKNKENELTISSWVKTVVIGKLIRNVHNWGTAEIVNLKPVYFELFQREGDFERDHHYHFKKNGVEYSIIKFKGDEEREEITRGFYRSSVFLYDPFTASLLVYLKTPSRKLDYIQVFYDEKLQNIRYRTIGEEDIEIDGLRYSTWKVVLIPEIDTKGTLKPIGNWYLWIDKLTLLPVMLQIKFNIGSAKVYLKSIRGDPKVLRNLKKRYIKVKGL